jgi:hypothetical protein
MEEREMGVPTDPPHLGLRQATRDFIASCTWNNTTGQLEYGGAVVKASLHQVSASGFGVTVEWLASVAADYGAAVTVVIPQATYDIVKNGTFNSQTGVVTHGGKNYIFEHKMSGSVRSMLARIA